MILKNKDTSENRWCLSTSNIILNGEDQDSKKENGQSLSSYLINNILKVMINQVM